MIVNNDEQAILKKGKFFMPLKERIKIIKELLCGDEKGVLTFIKIFDKSQIKLKAVESSIFYLHNIELFNELEHLVIASENAFEVINA